MSSFVSDQKKIIFCLIVFLGSNFDPFLASNISGMQWCILERIGRARELGEVTQARKKYLAQNYRFQKQSHAPILFQGKMSLQFLCDPKTLFYHRRALLAQGVIRKQIHYQKIKGQNYQVSQGFLL